MFWKNLYPAKKQKRNRNKYQQYPNLFLSFSLSLSIYLNRTSSTVLSCRRPISWSRPRPSRTEVLPQLPELLLLEWRQSPEQQLRPRPQTELSRRWPSPAALVSWEPVLQEPPGLPMAQIRRQTAAAAMAPSPPPDTPVPMAARPQMDRSE